VLLTASPYRHFARYFSHFAQSLPLLSSTLGRGRGKMSFHSFADSSTDSSVRLTGTVYPLDIEDRRYYHPSSRAQWERVPGRPTAWRLHPYSYMWVPSSELFPAVGHSHTGSFPREFTLLVTLRIHPQVRSGSFYTLELFQFNMTILVHNLIRYLKILSSIPDRQLQIF